MKTLKIKYLMTILLLAAGSVSFCQNDYNRIFYTNDISIIYIVGPEVRVNKTTGDSAKVTEYRTIDNISKLAILNDSLIRVSKDNLSDAQLNINKINSIRIKNGSYMGIGIGVGALAGLCIGLIVGSSLETGYEKSAWEIYISPTAWGAIAGIPLGALIFGVTGSYIPSYDTYEMNRSNIDKMEELNRIIRIDGMNNGWGQ